MPGFHMSAQIRRGNVTGQVAETHSSDLFLQQEPHFSSSSCLEEGVCLSTTSHGDFR